jgi:hypothetical protein
MAVANLFEVDFVAHMAYVVCFEICVEIKAMLYLSHQSSRVALSDQYETFDCPTFYFLSDIFRWQFYF